MRTVAEPVPTDAHDPRDEAVVEWATFRIAAATEEATLLSASDVLQRDFLQQQDGFLRRELLRAADGQWVDLVVWRDQLAASAAMRAAGDSAVCHAYFRLLEGGDSMDAETGVQHLRRVRSY